MMSFSHDVHDAHLARHSGDGGHPNQEKYQAPAGDSANDGPAMESMPTLYQKANVVTSSVIGATSDANLIRGETDISASGVNFGVNSHV
jgi:hypothetical protein